MDTLRNIFEWLVEHCISIYPAIFPFAMIVGIILCIAFRWVLLYDGDQPLPLWCFIFGGLIGGLLYPITSILLGIGIIVIPFHIADCLAEEKQEKIRIRNRRISAGGEAGLLSAPETDAGQLTKCGK